MSANEASLTSDAITACRIIDTYEIFAEAYNNYVRAMDDLISTANEPLYQEAKYLIAGLDDVTLFIRNADYVLPCYIWPLTRV